MVVEFAAVVEPMKLHSSAFRVVLYLSPLAKKNLVNAKVLWELLAGVYKVTPTQSLRRE